MKIAHVVSSFPPYFGGMGNVAFQTVNELQKRGHEVVVYTTGYYEEKEIKGAGDKPEKKHDKKLEKEIENVKRLSPTFRYGNAARLPQLGKELDDFDLVHLHYPFFGTANIIRKWKIRNMDKPLVITYHMDPRGIGLVGIIFKLYAKYYSAKILGIADKVIASSLDYVETTEAAKIMKTNPNKWMEIPFGVDTEKFKPRYRPEPLFNRHDLDIDSPVILFVGGMDRAHYFKGVSVLLRALYILKRKNIRIQALFIGGGELKQEFELEAKSYGISNYVKFAGHVKDDELPYYYNMGDLFVLPSIHKGEAFGMVLLEAMASGVPVIASNLPGVRKVALDGGTTFETKNPADLAEAILGYFESDDETQFLWVKRARQSAMEKYGWEPIVDRLEEVYLDLVG